MNTGPGKADHIVASIMRGKALAEFADSQHEDSRASFSDAITDLVNADLALHAIQDPDSLGSRRRALVGLMQELTSITGRENYGEDDDDF